MSGEQLAQDLGGRPEDCRVEVSSNPAEAVIAAAKQADLVVIGLSGRPGQPLIGPFVERLAREAGCPLIAIAHPS